MDLHVYINFNVPPTRILQIRLEMYQKKDLLIWNSHLCRCFCFYQLGLCSVSHSANKYSIYHFCIMTKDHFFFKSDYCPRLLCIICIQPDFLCYFLLNEKGTRFNSVQ